MVSITLPSSLDQASPLQVAVGATLVAVVAYKLVLEDPPHVKYAKKHGLTNIKPARRLKKSHFLMGDVAELTQNAPRFVDWFYEKMLEMDEQPWLRKVPSLPDSIMIATPEMVEDVTKTQNDVFGKGPFTRTAFGDLIGDSFFNLDGEAWFHQRKIASRFFTVQTFRNVATALFNKHAEVVFGIMENVCDTPQPLNLSMLLHEFTLQSIAELGFGLQMNLIGTGNGHPLNVALEEALPQILYRLQTPEWVWKLQKWLNIGGERQYRETIQDIRRIVGEMVTKSLDKCQAKGPRAEPTNIVELFIHAMQDGEAEAITPEILRDIAVMFVLGGRDTTADTITWLFYLVSKHPEVERKIRAELWEKVPELMEGKIKNLTMEHTQRLTYIEAVIKETLRLYPPVAMNVRQANRETHLVDGTYVPKGCAVGLSAYAMGRLKSVWGDDAHEFKPERFIDAETGKLLIVSSFKFFSFNAGPRICIGMNMALIELKLVIATLMSRFSLDVLPNDGSYKFSASLPLKNPLMARIRRAPESKNS